MPDETIDQRLREMAEHRGFKLVKSRRRKPGSGDYGKFGLTQADGKALLGIGEAGLTASASDIESYLRKGSVSTWKASAETVPARAASKPDRSTGQDDDVENAPVIRPRRKNAATRKSDVGHATSGRQALQSTGEQKTDVERRSRPSKGGGGRSQTEARPNVRAHTDALSPPPPAPAPKLDIRVVRPGDAAGLAKLLRQLAHVDIDEPGIARNLEAARKAKGGMVVAELGMLVGCCAWAYVPTIQYGLIGRITMILVDEDHRRRGIATDLFKAASGDLSKAGCTRVEAMSDIEIRNAHGFFRTLQFEQTSYRFARDLDPDA
ncbi:GNAT family N-acetyltransferase [Sphingomonas sp. VDB2]|uniref:GNAT family N-acetyltransferase n=1 Tax=Sphingomonas sp. VDB2 TaxID=3228751 RepID=UPI003A811A74